MKFNNLEQLTLRLRQNFSHGSIKLFAKVLDWLTSLSVHCSTGAEDMVRIAAYLNVILALGLTRGSARGSPVWVSLCPSFRRRHNLACSDSVTQTGNNRWNFTVATSTICPSAELRLAPRRVATPSL